MRSLRLSTLCVSSSLLLGLALGATGCNRACPSAGASLPSSATSTGEAIDVRFVVSARSGNVSQLVLLRTSGASVTPVHDFASGTAASWLDDRGRWPDMIGSGLGSAPVLAAGLSHGPFVGIGAATSVAQLTLEAPSTLDAGIPATDAGIAPTRARRWEWRWPALSVPDGVDAPRLADMVVIPRYLPDHDVAVVSRTAVSVGGSRLGGELFLLDVDDPTTVVPLATLSLDTYADPGLHAVASGLYYAPDGLVYAAVDHQSFESTVPTAGPGMVVVVDPGMRAVRTVLRIPTLTGCTEIAPYHPPSRVAGDPADPGETFRLVVTCRGSAVATGTSPTDAGFVYVEHDPASIDTMPVIAQTITASSLSLPRPDGGSAPLYGHWIAYVSRGTAMTSSPDRLIAANLASGDHPILATAIADDGGSHVGLGQSAFDPASGVLVVPNGFDGVDTWQMPSEYHVIESGTYAFPDRTEVAVVTCGHLAARTARTVQASGGAVPTTDAGTMRDAGPRRDAAGDVDAAGEVDAATDVDAAIDVDAGV